MTQSKMYKRHRFPPEIIQYAVWLYHCFSLSHRDIKDLMSQRVQYWTTFGVSRELQVFTNGCLCILGKGSGDIGGVRRGFFPLGRVNLSIHDQAMKPPVSVESKTAMVLGVRLNYAHALFSKLMTGNC